MSLFFGTDTASYFFSFLSKDKPPSTKTPSVLPLRPKRQSKKFHLLSHTKKPIVMDQGKVLEFPANIGSFGKPAITKILQEQTTSRASKSPQHKFSS
jgi:hypothetical protein